MITGRRLRVVVALAAAAILPLGVAPITADAAVVPTITAVAAATAHTCALTSLGGVKCWGSKIVNGTTTDSLTPVSVVGLTSGVSAISAGGFHTCALTSTGGVKCWGTNDGGQLGNGTTTTSLTPVSVVGLTSGVSAISAGGSYACALTTGGGVKCWGFNGGGQLGNGTTTKSSVPVDVSGLTSGVTAIDAGTANTCALTTGGEVKCWGYNYYGQLGNGTTTNSSIPVSVSGFTSGVSAIAPGGGHSCALTSGGAVKCWGDDTNGQLGVNVSDLTSGVSAISAGYNHTCALTSERGVKCWGAGELGQLGNGETIGNKYPSDVAGLTSGVTAIDAGYLHTCALTNEGGVKCWGANNYGTLGNGTRNASSVPVDVDFATNQTIILRTSTIILRTSKRAGTIARGTVVWFTATVRPLPPAGTRATVRFVVYRLVDGVWRLAAQRDVAADPRDYGRARLPWTFSKVGSWYVRAKALGNTSYAASTWSPLFRYTVP